MRSLQTNKKRYGVLIMIMIANWLVLAWMIFKIDPEIVRDVVFKNSYLPMIIVFLGAVFWPLSIILLSAKKALRWSSGLTLVLYLQIADLGSVLNFILIFGILIVSEYYFSIKLSAEEFKSLKNATFTEQNKQNN